MTARNDQRLREISNGSLLSVPDGRPLSVIARYRGLTDVCQVAGPDFLPHFLAVAGNVRHFFYGSTLETLERLTANFRQRFPAAIIAGSYSPPFRPLGGDEAKEVLALILRADNHMSSGSVLAPQDRSTGWGNRIGAARSYRFVRDVWRPADAPLQPYVREAEAALARLRT